MKKRLSGLLVLILLLQCLWACAPEGGLELPITPCASKEEHTDADNNGVCDKCRGDVTVTLGIYAVNDLHGKIADTGNNGGVDELSTYLKNCAATDEASLFLSSGDTWQGSAESNATRGLLATDWMNEMGFVSMTLGNHEFDWGEAQIEANREIADFPFLAINIFERDTDRRPDYCSPSVLVQRGELTVGIIGAIGDCYSSISPDQVENLYFVTGFELGDLVIAEAQRLREAGADFIIYSVHDGHDESTGSTVIGTNDLSAYYDPRLSKGGHVDIVFEGHTHKSYAMKDLYGVYHFQGGGDNRGITYATVEINYVTDTHEMYSGKYVESSTYARLSDDPVVAELMEKYDALIAPTREALGTNSLPLSSDAICDRVAQLYSDFGERTWGDKYNIFLGGGYLQLRSPYSLPQGQVIYADLMMILPFDNRLMLCSISGRDLEQRFLNTSNDSYHTGLGTYGEQNRNQIDPDGTYYVVVDSYTAQYAPNRLTVVAEYDKDYFARDLLADYIKSGGMA